MPLLEDKVAIVTGAATGIGEGVARLFADEGAHVYVLDLNGAGACAVASSIGESGGSALWFESDVRRPETVRPAVDDAIQRFGRVDILINNAGIYPRQRFLDMTERQWDEMQDVNIKGVFHCTKLVLPHMVRQNFGHIVNISSVTFHIGSLNLSHYVASKGAIIGLTRTLAREVGEYGVHVNCITPGAVKTESESRIATQAQVDEVVALQSLRRRILPLDIARACLFLSCEMSDGMTGQILNVDGGWIMH